MYSFKCFYFRMEFSVKYNIRVVKYSIQLFIPEVFKFFWHTQQIAVLLSFLTKNFQTFDLLLIFNFVIKVGTPLK